MFSNNTQNPHTLPSHTPVQASPVVPQATAGNKEHINDSSSVQDKGHVNHIAVSVGDGSAISRGPSAQDSQGQRPISGDKSAQENGSWAMFEEEDNQSKCRFMN